MTGLFARWLATALVAIGLGVAGLHLSVCIAQEQGAVPPPARPSLFTGAPEPELPIEAEVDAGERAAAPRLTY